MAFEDSTIEPAQKALSDGNLSVFDTYETEYSLIHTPVFLWDQDEAKPVEPNQNLTITLQCFGKVGWYVPSQALKGVPDILCSTAGTIHISYAHAKDPNLKDSNAFYVRQVSYPLMVTVYHMLECSGMDILQFPVYPQLRTPGQLNSRTDKFNVLQTDYDVGWCLFSIEVRNTYGSPFDVTLVRNQDDKPTASSTSTIPPGSVPRQVFSVFCIYLS